MPDSCRRALYCLLLCGAPAMACAQETGPEAKPDPANAALPPLQAEGAPYRTPLSGAGFKTTIFDKEIEVPARDRRSVTAWDLGMASVAPGVNGAEIQPFASLYFWRRPDDEMLFRAVIVGLYNEIYFSKTTPDFAPFEVVLTLENYTIPFPSAEFIDGKRQEDEELYWGWVRPGLGFGYRTPSPPGEQDNMFALSLTVEPSYVYFHKSAETARNFKVPVNTFEPRLHLQCRWDAMLRNLLELPHQGFEAGGDYVHGYRPSWKDWGIDRSEDSHDNRDYDYFTGYLLAASGIPFLASDRHRLIGSVHGCIASDVDRFSAPRIGGGPNPFGEEYGSTFRPAIPGAVIDEYFPRYYTAAIGEYRWEPVFFTYLSLRTSIAALERLRRRENGIRRSDDVFSSIGARITTGFIFDTRLQLDYNYSFGVVRQDEFGGHEVVAHLSAEF